MPGDLNAAIDQAMAICWNEGYGYNLGGMAHSYADGVDCSGLVGRVLHDNGFNYPSYHVGTINMGPALISAGFTEYNYTSSFQMQSGDIVVMNHLDMTGGHTFFYVEDIRAYTDPYADSANIGIVHKAKVEASSSRGHTAQGDHRKNGNGAYWEVWCHAYAVLINGYDWTDPGDTVRVYRYPGGYYPGRRQAAAGFMAMLSGFAKSRRKRGLSHGNY